MTEQATNVTVSLEIKPLGEIDVELLERLVETPVFGALKRLYTVERVKLLNDVTNELDSSRVKQLQGKIQGVTLLENLPMVLRSYRAAIDAGKKKADLKQKDADRQAKRAARRGQ
jgi:hypothetical protein